MSLRIRSKCLPLCSNWFCKVSPRAARSGGEFHISYLPKVPTNIQNHYKELIHFFSFFSFYFLSSTYKTVNESRDREVYQKAALKQEQAMALKQEQAMTLTFFTQQQTSKDTFTF